MCRSERNRDTVRPPVFDQLPFGQWYKACASEKDAKGQQSCWFICNRAGGCLNDAAKCKRSHEFKPKDYADKHWDGELAAPRQRPPERQTCFDQLTDRTRIRHHRDAKRHKRHEAGTPTQPTLPPGRHEPSHHRSHHAGVRDDGTGAA